MVKTMKKTWTVIAMLAALCCASCDSNDKEKSNCTEGVRICDAGMRMECVNGDYVALPCPSGRTCNSGQCVSPLECDPSVTKPVCVGNSVKYCSESKWTIETTDCGGLTCTNGANGAYCDPTSVAPDVVCIAGAQRCTSTGAHQVCANNAWTDSPCGAGKTCKAGECVAEAACKEGATRCAADEAIQMCENGAWKTVSVCNQPGADTCINGACTTKPACPAEGDACNNAGDVLCCEDKAYMCDNSKKYAIVEECADGSTCDTVEEYGVVGCVSESCGNDDIGYFMTYGESCYDDNTFDLYACLKGDSGVNGIFPAAYAESFCADKNKKLVCNSQGKVVTATCTAPDCASSYNESTYNYEATCTMGSAGDSCDASFAASCKDNKTTMTCVGGKIKETACTGDLVCSGGKCVEAAVSSDYTLCDSSCKVQGGQTCIAVCQEESASSTCVLDNEGYIECSETCSNAGDTTPVCITAQGAGYLLTQICTNVSGKMLFITDYSDYSQCPNGCNAAGTACK